MNATDRDVLTPREISERSGFSYHAILRAIRRGDISAFEPVAGHYRVELAEYERWLRRPLKRVERPLPFDAPPPRPRINPNSTERGSLARLRAIEGS